ncbi:MAG: hypothetical protein IJP90_11490 [Treponema sp.]|nr:hypothetical protein [Treponema sp.]
MKKIISTLALATLAFGSVFADVTFTTNYRTRMAGFSRVMNRSGADANGSFSPAADAELHNSYLFAQRAYGNASDDFAIAVSSDIAGASVKMSPDLRKRGTEAPATGKDEVTDRVTGFGEYYGWVNLGAIKLTAGLVDGINNGNYRLTGEVGHNLEGESADAFGYLGSMHKYAISYKADDLSQFNGDKRPVGMITYKGEFGDTVLTADLVAAAIDSDGATNTWDGHKIHSAFGARLDFKIPAVDVQFVFKQHANKVNAGTKKSDASNEATRSVALHVAPNLGENLNLVVGGAAGFYNGDLTEFNADVRFLFKSGNMSFTSLNNISYITNAAATGYLKGKLDYDAHVGLCFVDSTGALKKEESVASQSSMWNLIGFSMALSEKLTVFANVGDIIGFNAGCEKNGKHYNNGEIGDFGMELFAAPGVQFFATKNCSITTALRLGVSNLLRDTDTYKDIEPAYGILVPVVMRVQL